VRRAIPAALLLAATAAPLFGQAPARVAGVVRDGSAPVAGATVRIQGTATFTRTNDRGEFTLEAPGAGLFVPLTAYAPGYYIAGPVPARPGDANLAFSLKRHPAEDDPTYEWLPAHASSGGDSACQNCHSEPKNPFSSLPFDEWVRDAHGRSAANRRFLSMYNGTDLSGERRSPPTRYFIDKDYGPVPLAPDPALPYYGPGFNLDFPNSAGNCAACHLPAASANAAYDTDPNLAQGAGKEGVTCDVCHKLWSVRLNHLSGLPHNNTPGVLSMEFRRPSQGHQLFLGPYDDVAPGEDSYSPLQNQGRFCAPCHSARFWGVQVYDSYGEWLASPYSDPETGQTCQDCHMPRRGAALIARADRGAIARDPKTVFSHLMTGASDVTLLENTATLTLEVWREGKEVRVMTVVTNDRAGHHIPTDHPARNILLVVSATGLDGQPLAMRWGDLVPPWGGEGEAAEDYAGRPGRGYAKILEEMWTEVAPTAAYWNPTVLREDTRIPALASDVANWGFEEPSIGGPVKVTARLIFRRAFRALQKQKSWDTPDILMNEATRTVP
jgi:nitrate/TMAO reductase-like tetraheme cytochrome c subunit